MSIDSPTHQIENEVAAAARVADGHKHYGSGDTEVRALDGVTVEFGAGRFTAIMGPSGSGKSTLMHCAAGLDDLTSGSAFIGDTELGSLSERDLTMLRRDRVGFVFQAFNLLPTLTAIENLNLPLTLAGRSADPEWLDQVVTSIGIGDRLDHRPNELSGGQQQRVAIARAIWRAALRGSTEAGVHNVNAMAMPTPTSSTTPTWRTTSRNPCAKPTPFSRPCSISMEGILIPGPFLGKSPQGAVARTMPHNVNQILNRAS